ncbi:trehalose-6-phosphate synthase [Rhodococcus sp. IEGM 1366]|uniref:alpha,alpha-trehalose-phosphate synthase (UDP-forming) n=1 Tax=Rhodococcus sp. IEGM 1366 TaxID=3082223 RepID=UPI002955966B|nr:trehalose-6-phosphate synthase [Rhodococcus sp. IEGM 1366]MDV8069078.1 trehalose-6-phosphate synthase [Rhodococcus sp. IEGM 1366]
MNNIRQNGEGHADFVVVANRLPVDLERRPDGTTSWRRSPGGLVTALEPILRAKSGAWVGWPGVPDEHVEHFTEDGLALYPVSLSSQEVAEYYEGFSNDTLWPLYHDVLVPPTYDRNWWGSYSAVNRRFAEEAARCAAPGATVWIQDYQLQLVPKILRELRPDLEIGFFLHIPFPPVELFMQLPWRREIIEGMLGADLIGFHLPGGANNFLFLAHRLLELETTRTEVGSVLGQVHTHDRIVNIGAFPISVDSRELEAAAKDDTIVARAIELRRELGNPDKILLGVDRLDYTKGIDLRLEAIKELLDEGRLDAEHTVMVQLATPSRERVQHYIDLRGVIEEHVGHINGDHAQIGHPIVHYLYQPVSRDELIALFVAADVMLVTPKRDGMNLVAKEYVACRGDLGGALVLSEFTGAAMELRQSYLVNPHDLDGVKNMIMTALHQDAESGRRRMSALHRQVMSHDVHRWAHSFLTTLTDSAANGTVRDLTDTEHDLAVNA